MMFSDRIINAAMEHARAEFPRESCGLVVDDKFVPRNNTALDPEKDFRIAPQAWLAAESRGTVRGVIHSHPEGTAHPSRSDMAGQIGSGLAWGIIPMQNGRPLHPFFWGGDTPMQPLVGREFRSGVADCYALARDWYLQEHGVTIMDCPRAPGWDAEDDLFMDHFSEAGFEIVLHGLRPEDLPRLQPGDGILLQICSAKVNHCGVYLGKGLMLHHLVDRLSREDVLARWASHVRYVLRRAAA